MSARWVAGSVRAKALLDRRLGVSGARALAEARSLDDALAALVKTPYGHDVRIDHTLAEAEHAVGATLLWHMRVLAGWQPRAQVVRLLAGGFEISNVDNPGRYRLGALASAWSRSATDDPVGLRLAWADRVIAGVPDAAEWAVAAAALLVARERFVVGQRLDERRTSRVVGGRATAAMSLPDFVSALPASARWAFADVTGTEDLWRGEVAWWKRLERDGFSLVHESRFDSRAVVGVIAVLATDAWRTRAALQVAARGGVGLEVFDAIA